MKLTVLISLCVLLAIVAENSASPARPGAGVPAAKAGSCYRPGQGRRRRAIELETEDLHIIQKRQIQGGNGGSGGNQGGNPWRPPPTTQRPQCQYDHQCPGNKKCCYGACQTPAFVG